MLSELADDSTPIRATYNSFRILDEIQRREGAGVTELANSLDLSKSTIHDHLVTLRELGCVKQVNGAYIVSPLMLSYGGHATQNIALAKFAKDEVDFLADETGETAKVVIEENGRGLYLYQSRSSKAIHTDAHTGTIVYLHATGVGKAILSQLPRDRVDEIIDTHGLPAKTERTMTNREDLYAELETISERGIAFDNEERIDGIRCVAAPIMRDDEVLGALSISGPKRRIDDTQFRETYPELIRETVRMIELNATYSTRPA